MMALYLLKNKLQALHSLLHNFTYDIFEFKRKNMVVSNIQVFVLYSGVFEVEFHRHSNTLIHRLNDDLWLEHNKGIALFLT